MIIIELANDKIIKIELDEKAAPITTQNFIELVNDHFYDGLLFHRIIKGFMIQGGCPLGNGTGGSGKTLKGEFSTNGINNQLKHTRGTISMARASNPDSASSQFFIMHQDAHHLDGKYAAFGHVTEGMDVIDEIASVKIDDRDKPLDPIIMKKVYIEK